MSDPEHPVTYINLFEVPEGREAEFLRMYADVNAYMRKKPGFVSNQMHEATMLREIHEDEGTASKRPRFSFVNIVKWASREDFSAARDEEFRRLAGTIAMHIPGFTTTAAEYTVVSENDGGATP